MVFRMARGARMLALGLWVGAMTGFAFVVAPIVFHILGPTSQFAAIVAATVVAIAAFGYACGGVALAATAVLLRARKRSSIAILILVAAMLLGSWYEVHAIVPLMQHTPLHTPAYDRLHQRSSTLYAGILLAGLIAWVLGSRRDG